MRWPDPGLQAQLHRKGDDLVLELQATRLTRALRIDFGAREAELSDNALTLLPGERVSLQVSSQASLEALHQAMQLRSLADVIARP